MITAHLEKHDASVWVIAELISQYPKHVDYIKSDLTDTLSQSGVDRVFFREPEFDPEKFAYKYEAYGYQIVYEYDKEV